MKKHYIQPQIFDVAAQMGEDILDGNNFGQSYVPVDKGEGGDIEFSAKENEGDYWDTNLWDDNETDNE